MTIRQNYIGKALAFACLAGSLALVCAPQPTWAGDLSTQQILDGLKVSKTRSLSAPERPALTTEDLALIKRVRGKTRSLSLGEREQIASITPKRPTIDLDINFDYNSASLTPKVEPQLNMAR